MAVDGGSILQATTTAAVGGLGLAIGIASRRAKTTKDTIDEARSDLEQAVHDLRIEHDHLRADVSTVRSDVAEIKGFLAAFRPRGWPLRDPR